MGEYMVCSPCIQGTKYVIKDNDPFLGIDRARQSLTVLSVSNSENGGISREISLWKQVLSGWKKNDLMRALSSISFSARNSNEN